MSRRILAILAGSAILSMAISPAFAQTKMQKGSTMARSTANMERIKPRSTVNSQDRRFIMDAAHINMAEVMLGELAQQRGGSWARGYGADMVREHNMAMAELRTVAKSAKVNLPKAVDSKHKAVYARLSKLSGAAFDSAYRSEMIKGHGMALQKMRGQVRNGSNSMIRNYAVKMEPGVAHHLEMARNRTTMTGG